MTDPASLPTALPLFPLGGAILLPGERLPLNVFEPRYLNMVDDVRRAGGHIGIIQTRPGGTPEAPALAGIGGAGKLVHFETTEDGRYLIALDGVCRFRLARELDSATPYRVARADYVPFKGDLVPRQGVEGDRSRLIRLLESWFAAEHLAADWESLAQAPITTLVDQLSMMAPFASPDRQRLLEAPDLTARLETMEDILAGYVTGAADRGDGPVQ